MTFVASALAALIQSHPAGYADASVPAPLPDVSIPIGAAATSNVLALCDGDNLSLSPSGRYLATWHSDRPVSGPIIFPVDCLLTAGSCSGWYVRPPEVQGFVWADDDTGYLLSGPDFVSPVRKVHPATGDLTIDRATVLAGMGRTARPVRLEGLVDPAGERWTARLEALGPDYTPIGQWAGPDGVYSTMLDRRDHRLALLEPDGAVRRTDLSARWATGLIQVRDQSGAAYLAGDGVLHRAQGLDWRPALPGLHQPRPLIDASTGALVGAYDDKSVVALDGSTWANGLLDETPLDQIQDVATASSTGFSAALVRRLDGQRELRLKSAGGRPVTLACPVNGRDPNFGRPPPVPAALEIEDWGSPESPLPVRRRTLPGDARGTVVLWGGGPGSTFAMGRSFDLEQEWLRRGFNTAIIDGAGANGLETGRRLRDGGLAGVVDDAHAAARHIGAHREAFESVVITGTGFGGVAAAEMARNLAAERLKRPPALLLVSPRLRYRDPAEYYTDPDDGWLVDSERLANAATFGPLGGEQGYDSQVAAWRDAYRFEGPALATFVQSDRRARPEDLWTWTPAETLVVPSWNDERIEARIDRWLDEIASATPVGPDGSRRLH